MAGACSWRWSGLHWALWPPKQAALTHRQKSGLKRKKKKLKENNAEARQAGRKTQRGDKSGLTRCAIGQTGAIDRVSQGEIKPKWHFARFRRCLLCALLSYIMCVCKFMGLWNTPLYDIVHFAVRIHTLCNSYWMLQLAALTLYSVHMRAYVGEGNGVYEITTEFKVVIVLSVDKVSFSIAPSESYM